ncbi:MAG: YlxM family DNA-binding protein [Lachnospiraceae bacterium]|nr:YlxM family DNA-binding protein [Lachnospiraceae bacterium]
MEEFVEQTLLYDFYGELLTQHQKKIYEDFVCNDLSLSEIAEEQGISRQGVHDLIKRSKKILEEYEQKLHLIEKFIATKKKVEEINQLLTDYDPNQKKEIIEKIKDLTDHILEEL